MEKHAIDPCPLCGELFTCKVNSIFNCDCMKVKLTPSEAAFIRYKLELTTGSPECVCTKCLKALKTKYLEQSRLA